MLAGADLAKVCGFDSGSRGQVIKAVWEYINAEGLKTKGGVKCDKAMEKVFGMKKITAKDVMGGIRSSCFVFTLKICLF